MTPTYSFILLHKIINLGKKYALRYIYDRFYHTTCSLNTDESVLSFDVGKTREVRA